MTGKKNPILITPSAPNNKKTKSFWNDDDNFVDNLIKEIKQKREYDMAIDPKKDWRAKEQLCKQCAYTSWFGGSAMTTSHCKECGKEMLFPSTNVDVYCIDCAQKLDICKHCGRPMD